MKNLDKFKGCLIGGAAGDALGYSVEFLQEQSIFRKYGQNGITSYDLTNGKALISDDTQMTLFTASGLLVGAARERAGSSYTSCIASCYKEWYRTQTETFPLKNNDGSHVAWLANVPELFDRRAPGMTCMSAIHDGCKGTMDEPENDSKGCGGVMRVAPIGLYFMDNARSGPNDAMRIGAEAAALTHGHELGYIPAAALVHIVGCLAKDGAHSIPDAVKDAVARVHMLFPHAQHLQEFEMIMKRAMDLAASDIEDREAIHALGEGWVAEETLAIAVYCALKYPTDIEKGLIAAVNHNGDSDSTGAVAGNIIGANIGLSGIPDKFLNHLELRDVILEIAEDLYSGYAAENCPAEWKHKYIHEVCPS